MTTRGYTVLGWIVWQIGSRVAKKKIAENRVKLGAAGVVTLVLIGGVIVLVVAASTEGPTSLSNTLQIQLHILLDYALAAFLIASPFLFGYSDETAPTAFFIGLGVVHLLVTVGTRYLREERG